MSRKKFKEYNLDQQYLVPPDLRDWVPEDDFSRYVDDLVSNLDLTAFEDAHTPGVGQPPYDPAMMLKVLLYCYCNGIFSSRKMERATYKDVGARFLAGNVHPDYSSFANFRKKHKVAFEAVFLQVVTLSRLVGMTDLAQVCIDGTVIKANASRRHNVLTSDLEAISKTACDEFERKADAADAQDERNSNPLPEELRNEESRRKALRKAKATVAMLAVNKLAKDRFDQENERAEREKLSKSNADHEPERNSSSAAAELAGTPSLTLREARKNKRWSQDVLARATGIQQARLSQFERDERTPNDEEYALLCDALEVDGFKVRGKTVKVAKVAEPKPRKFTNLTDPDSYIICRKDKSPQQGFNCQAAVDSKSQIILAAWLCPDTHDRKALVPTAEILEKSGLLKSVGRIITDCGYFSREAISSKLFENIDLCIPPERNKPKKKAANPDPLVEAMREKMETEEGKAARKLRAHTAEPPFGRMKTGLGFTRFLCRGFDAVGSEWILISLAHNALKMTARWSKGAWIR